MEETAATTPSAQAAGAGGDQLDRVAGGIGLLVGVGALLAPRLLLRIYGIDPAELNGVGLLGWRLFAIRNIAIGSAAVGGNRQAQDAVLGLQAPDIALFAHCYWTESIPRPVALKAMLTAGLVATLGLVARVRSPR